MGKDQKPGPEKESGTLADDAVKDKTEDAPASPKPDPSRYGDWTVNGIAVDF